MRPRRFGGRRGLVRLVRAEEVEAVGDAGGEDRKDLESVYVFFVFVDLRLEVCLHVGVGGGIDAVETSRVAGRS